MGEIGSSHWTIYPKIADTFGSDASAQIGKASGPALAPFEKQSTEAGKKSGKTFGESFRSVAAPLLAGAAITGALSLVRSSVDAFSELQDATSAAAVIFGDSMQTIIDQSKGAATSLGLSQKQVIDSANTFGTFGKSAGLAGDDLAQFSVKMTKVAGDLSSFKGGSPEDAIEAVGAALRGESEPIRRYGVLLDDATLRQQALKMGLIETTKNALTPQQRVLASQAVILAQSTDAMGDFARTADSTANVAKTLAAEQANLSAELGEKLAPAITAAQKAGIGLIDWVTQNQAAIVPFVGTVGTLTLAVGGFVAVAKGVEALKAAKATLVGLGEAFEQMSTKAKIATASAGAIGIALTVAAGVYGIFAQKTANAKAAVEDYTQALEADNGALGENVRLQVAKKLQETGALDAANRLGISLDLVTSAVLGQGDAMERVTGLIAGQSDKMGEQTAESVQLGEAARILSGILGDQNHQFATAVQGYQNVASASRDTTSATKTSTSVIDTNTHSLKANIEKTNALYDARLKLRGDKRSFEAAIDDATKALKDNGKTLDVHTEKGRANQEALDGIAQSGRDWVQSLKDQKKPQSEINEAMKDSRTAFIRAATAMGMGGTEAARLATKLGLVKDDASKAKEKLSDLAAKAKALDGTHITFSVSAAMNKSGGEIVYSTSGHGSLKFTAREFGGPIRAGEAYVVGEKRPELFLPNVSGFMLPSVPKAVGGVGASSSIDPAAIRQALEGMQISMTGASVLGDHILGELHSAMEAY